MRTAEFEIARFKTPEMLEASTELIVGLSKHIDNEPPITWRGALFVVRDSITNQTRQRFEWQTPLMNLVFSGFQPVLQRVVGERLEMSANSPYFALTAGWNYRILDDEEKAAFDEDAKTVIMNVAEEHQLHVVPVDPELLFVKFPKEVYAECERVEVPLLE